MKKRTVIRGAVALSVVAALATTGTVVAYAQGNDEELGAALDAILEDDAFEASQAGVVVADAKTGEPIYNHGGGKRAIPASTNKLLTSSAAMHTLGGDYTFGTYVASEAKPSGGTLAGDVYLRGTGDPTMLAEDYGKLAEQLAKAGVKTVDGNLVADDTAYDSQRLGTEWGWDDEPYYYAAQTSALTVAPDGDYDAGSVIVSVKPGAEGEDAKVTLTPPTDHVTVKSTATTGGETDLDVNREHGSNTITVSGNIAAGEDPATEYMSVDEPTGYAADIFSKALADNGITVNGDTKLGQATPKGAKNLAKHKSMKLSKMLVPFMKMSNNMHAETLTKAMGREATGEQGTWDSGLEAIGKYLADKGVATDKMRQADGSGMSRQNVIPPQELTTLLSKVRGEKWFDTWYDALPIACEEDPLVGGTLKSRMCDTEAAGNVHGKTGSMTSVSALAGYVKDADGRELVFAVANNDYLADNIKELEDKIGATIAAYSQGESIDTKGIDVPQPGKKAPEGIECSWVKPIVC